MNIVITMAGSGERFRNAGFTEPKFMLKAKGQSLFRWSMASLKYFLPSCERLIFIVRDEDQAAGFIARELAGFGAPAPIIVPLPAKTDGQATSALHAETEWDSAAPLLIYNVDTHVDPQYVRPELISGAGWIPCFQAPGDHWSFVQVGSDGRAIEVREKERISKFASIGMYWFATAQLYEWAYAAHYGGSPQTTLPERYIAPIYNELIAAGLDVTICDVPVHSVVALGTPQELATFEAS